MDLESYGEELSMGELEGISGGVLTESKKEYIRKVIRNSKRNGIMLEDFMTVVESGSEEAEYVMSVWDQV